MSIEKRLTDRLQAWPGVCAAHLHGWIVGKDVVAQFVQRGFGICGGEQSSVLDFLPHLHVNLLWTQQWQDRIMFGILHMRYICAAE